MSYFVTASLRRQVPLPGLPLISKEERPPFFLCATEREYRARPGVTFILLVQHKQVDPFLEQNAIVCYSKADLLRYLVAPKVFSVETDPFGIRLERLSQKAGSETSYSLDGFKGLRKLELHIAMKGAQFLTGAENVSWHKLELRDLQRKNAYTVTSLCQSTLDTKPSLPYLGKEYLSRLTGAKEFVPNVQPLENFVYQEGVYIVKPIGRASSGEGITVVASASDLDKAHKKVYSKWKKGIVCQYINNPLLYEGKKFHLRVYLFVTSTGYSSLFPEAKLITARLPYSKGDYSNKDIHDTHLERTEKNLFFSTDFPCLELDPSKNALAPKHKVVLSDSLSKKGGFESTTESGQTRSEEVVQQLGSARKSLVWKQVERISAAVAATNFAAYSESKIGYDILGLDILVDDQYHCWLLEVNFSPGMDPVRYDDYAHFEKQFLQWEVSQVRHLLGL